ncbi:uncharacterized protein ISCGN_017765 [Ixodes scapularis]
MSDDDSLPREADFGGLLQGAIHVPDPYRFDPPLPARERRAREHIPVSQVRCTCESCPQEEGHCCRDIPKVAGKIVGKCITDGALFRLVCLDERLLNIAYEQLSSYEPIYFEPAARDQNK